MVIIARKTRKETSYNSAITSNTRNKNLMLQIMELGVRIQIALAASMMFH